MTICGLLGDIDLIFLGEGTDARKIYLCLAHYKRKMIYPCMRPLKTAENNM
jgi:hypothetical protein